MAHRHNGFFIFNKNQGWEYVFILGVVALAVGMIGAGRYSLDNALKINWQGWTPTVITIGVGLVPALGVLAACYRPSAKK